MSVEQPLWRALTVYRPLTMCYALGVYAVSAHGVVRPHLALGYYVLLAVWTLATLRMTADRNTCTRWFLAVDLGLALTGILLTAVVVDHVHIVAGAATLPSIWTAGAVLGFALKGGWRWAAVASALVGAANLVQRGALSRDTVHNVLLVWVVAIGIGYVIEVARVSERTLARALEIDAATRERERLARDIHDGVLQVLAMVKRRSRTLDGEAAELGRLAGEQEAALRALVTGRGTGTRAHPADGGSGAPGPRRSGGREAKAGARGRTGAPGEEGDPEGTGTLDVRELLAGYASDRVTVSEPGAPVPLAATAAGELAAAVGAAVDNVRSHAGEQARTWILIEDEPDAVTVTVRDDGPGIPEGRLARAAQEGRLGVAQSIRGRLRDLGGTAELVSVPGQGTEVELTVPRTAAQP